MTVESDAVKVGEYRYLSTSRGAGNSFFIKFIWIIIFCIATYLPREGTGINDDGINSYISYFCKEIARFEVFRNSIEPQTRMFEGELALPIHLERGRKLSSVWCQTCLPFLYRYLSTSRGAGNYSPIWISCPSRTYSYLSTSRGAGNLLGCFSRFFFNQYSYLSTSLGAGNGWQISSFPLAVVQLPIYLARGRKQRCVLIVNQSEKSFGIAPYLPREGPETCLCKVQYLSSQICIDTYLPREGSETPYRKLFLLLHKFWV